MKETKSLDGLPKWARSEIINRRREVAELHERLAAIGKGSGPIIYNAYPDKNRGEKSIILPADTVQFKLSDGGEIDFLIRETDGVQWIDVNVARGGGLRIQPRASNSAWIRAEDY